MEASLLRSQRVLELGTMIAAPFAAHILAELGAEVIKIEPPSGDPTRMLVRGGPRPDQRSIARCLVKIPHSR